MNALRDGREYQHGKFCMRNDDIDKVIGTVTTRFGGKSRASDEAAALAKLFAMNQLAIPANALGSLEENQQTALKADAGTSNSIQVSAELLRRDTPLFCGRIVLSACIIAAASLGMLSGIPLLFVIGMIVQGAMYIHLIELQHSALHLQAFESHGVTRIVGFLLGLPMMISFSDFQYRHLRHHKFLGTTLNTEAFNYSHTKLNTIHGFFAAMFDYSRWLTIAQRIFKSFSGQTITDGLNPLMEVRVRQEYQVFGLVLTITVLLSVLTASAWPLVLWLLPLIAAEPVHFLLELPEHFGLPAHTNPNVFENTRTWGGSLFARWFTHNTNYHIAHHYNQLVPMHKLPDLQKQLEPHIPQTSRSASYPGFYIEVLTGRVRPDFMDN